MKQDHYSALKIEYQKRKLKAIATQEELLNKKIKEHILLLEECLPHLPLPLANKIVKVLDKEL